MRIRSRLLTALAGVLFALTTVAAHAQALQEGRLLLATQVLNDLKGTRDQGIPQWLLQRAYGIAVIPDLTKVAFFFGARRGHGVLVVRKSDGRFSSPVFITLTGGSFGFQWGVQKTDLVLVFTSRKGVAGLSGGKVTLGASASVAAGPVGRQASAATVQTFNAAVYSYSHNKGLFAGVAVSGSEMTVDTGANAAFYGQPHVRASQIMAGTVSSGNSAATRFLDAVDTAAGMPAEEAAAAAPAATAPAGSPAPAAQAYPLREQAPSSSTPPSSNPPN
jgi:lipid-binding SYLF domain-containing protein